MVRRKSPGILRVPKYIKENDTRRYWYAEVLPDVPFGIEEDVENKISNAFSPTLSQENLQDLCHTIDSVKNNLWNI